MIITVKHGYDTSPAGHPAPGCSQSIGVTAVRSPAYAWNDPRLVDPDTGIGFQDQGRQRWRYLLVPHAGDWRMADATRRGAELRQPVHAMLERVHAGTLPGRDSYASGDDGSVVITAIKGAEEDLDDQDASTEATTPRPMCSSGLRRPAVPRRRRPSTCHSSGVGSPSPSGSTDPAHQSPQGE